LSIPAGVQTGQILNVQHQGNAIGFRVRVEVPTLSLSPEERVCYEKLKQLHQVKKTT
jgi:hypothetical protein